MIRINLIAERKAAAPKATRKKSQTASELQDNIIILVFAVLAIAVFLGRRHMINSETSQLKRTKAQKDKEYKEVSVWKERQLDYEIQKELLNDKINKISELKDRREGPVKLLEDIYNNVPSSVYLTSIAQGYDGRLVKPPTKGTTVFSPGENIGAPNQFRIKGRTKTIDAAGTLANRIFSIESRYTDGILSTVDEDEKEGQNEFEFAIFFKTSKGAEPKTDQGGGS